VLVAAADFIRRRHDKKKYHEDDDQKFAKDETRDDIPGMSVEVRLRCSIQQGTRLSDYADCRLCYVMAEFACE